MSGDRIAIIANGSLRCCGSFEYLRNRFGQGHKLTLVRASVPVGVDNSLNETPIQLLSKQSTEDNLTINKQSENQSSQFVEQSENQSRQSENQSSQFVEQPENQSRQCVEQSENQSSQCVEQSNQSSSLSGVVAVNDIDRITAFINVRDNTSLGRSRTGYLGT